MVPWLELLAIEGTHDVVPIGSEDHPALVVSRPINRKLYQLWTLVEAFHTARELPGFEVLRRMKRHGRLAVEMLVHHHHPVLARPIPDDFGIAAVMHDDRVALELRECPPTIMAVGKALAAACASPCCHEYFLVPHLPTGGIVVVDEATA